MLMTLDEMRSHLKDRNLDEVAQGTGLSRQTIYMIKSGKNTNPLLSVMTAITSYLDEQLELEFQEAKQLLTERRAIRGKR